MSALRVSLMSEPTTGSSGDGGMGPRNWASSDQMGRPGSGWFLGVGFGGFTIWVQKRWGRAASRQDRRLWKSRPDDQLLSLARRSTAHCDGRSKTRVKLAIETERGHREVAEHGTVDRSACGHTVQHSQLVSLKGRQDASTPSLPAKAPVSFFPRLNRKARLPFTRDRACRLVPETPCHDFIPCQAHCVSSAVQNQ